MSIDLTTLMACPRCAGDVTAEFKCTDCDWQAVWRGGIIETVDEQSVHVCGDKVKSFYGKRPFPGYADSEDAISLLDKGLANPFIRALDAIIPHNASVIDVGTGTGQIASILALRGEKRTVVGVDLTLEQLQEAERFREKASMQHPILIRSDLFALPFKAASFDVVISRGVVHHTQDPEQAIRRIARHVKPGGIVILGYYDGVGRLTHRMRRAVAKLVGHPVVALDPVLGRNDLDAEKKANWIADQYDHPVEHQMGLFQVKRCLEETGLTWIRSVPPFPESGNLAESTLDPGRLRAWFIQLGWMLRVTDQDAGLVCVIMRQAES